MAAFWQLLFVGLAAQLEPVETKFMQVYPAVKEGMERSPGQHRAVLLLHGLRLHPINNAKVHLAHFHDWQLPGSTMVKALARDSDVFAFAYGQNDTLEAIAATPGLTNAVGKLRFLGYQEIVLLGHSSGGLLARLFVEDHPDSGVTKVVQVCPPNEGSSWAKANFSVRKDQEIFLRSLTKEERLKSLQRRANKEIPGHVDFLCVVGAAGKLGDGLVTYPSQWSGDLQRQGIPALRLNGLHYTIPRTAGCVEKIAQSVRANHPRWTESQVQAMRKDILGQQ